MHSCVNPGWLHILILWHIWDREVMYITYPHMGSLWSRLPPCKILALSAPAMVATLLHVLGCDACARDAAAAKVPGAEGPAPRAPAPGRGALDPSGGPLKGRRRWGIVTIPGAENVWKNVDPWKWRFLAPELVFDRFANWFSGLGRSVLWFMVDISN